MKDATVDSALMADFASIARKSIGLVCDPTADASERWLVTIGLDWSGAGATPGAALEAAYADVRACSVFPA